MCTRKVSALSGGEATRLIFARLMIEKPNLLLLDEPTNHMDLETVDALSEALTRYDGSILFVSHYRHFVHKVATGILALTEDGYDYFKGSFQEYLESKGEDYLLRFGGVSRKSLTADRNKGEKEFNTGGAEQQKEKTHTEGYYPLCRQIHKERKTHLRTGGRDRGDRHPTGG